MWPLTTDHLTLGNNCPYPPSQILLELHSLVKGTPNNTPNVQQANKRLPIFGGQPTKPHRRRNRFGRPSERDALHPVAIFVSLCYACENSSWLIFRLYSKGILICSQVESLLIWLKSGIVDILYRRYAAKINVALKMVDYCN